MIGISTIPAKACMTFKEHPQRGKKFAQGMSFMGKVKGYKPHLLLDNYPWETKRTVVDVGGSHGTVAISIANRFPSVRCIVQDLPKVVEEGRERLQPDLADRVTFMAHDFFTEQPVVADVYYFRSIFHNWADKYCIRILRNLVPSLRGESSSMRSWFRNRTHCPRRKKEGLG